MITGHFLDKNPWVTRKEAMEYLRVKHTFIDDRTVTWDGHAGPIKGKIRAYPWRPPGGTRIFPRLLKVDVYKLLPNPTSEAVEPPRA